MSSEKTKDTGNKEAQLDPIIEEKKSDEEHELKITMNVWGIAFFIMFAAVAGYIMIGSLVFLPPFALDITDQILIITNPALLTSLIVFALVFLGLGYYFGWVRKPKETEEGETAQEQQLLTEKSETVIFSDTLENEDKEKT